MNRVRELRQSRKLSQLALAKEVGVARQTINLIENDKYNPSLDLCLSLCARDRFEYLILGGRIA